MIEPHFWFWDDQCDWMLSVSDMADRLLEAITKLEAVAASLDKPEDWLPSEAPRMSRYLSGEIEQALGDVSDVARTLKRNEFSIINTDAPTTDQLYGPALGVDGLRDRLVQAREKNPSPTLDEMIRRADEMIRRREQEKDPAHAV